MCMSPISIKIPENAISGSFSKSQEYFNVPCGKCPECRKSHAKEWAVRLMCEYMSLSTEVRSRCWFLTLTYNDLHNDGSLHPQHIRRFINSLRHKYKKNKIKYFYCGEFGTETYRPHYHMIIYDLPITDIQFYKQNAIKDNLYKSAYLEKIWGNGYVVVGQLSLASCNYTARYSLKKNNTDCFQSCSPGMSKKYFLDNYREIIGNNCVSVVSGKFLYKQKIPKYWLKLYRKLVGDKEYSKYLRWKNKTYTRPYVMNIYKKIFDRSVLDLNPRAADLGYLGTPIILAQKAKRLIEQALTDYQNIRENFI